MRKFLFLLIKLVLVTIVAVVLIFFAYVLYLRWSKIYPDVPPETIAYLHDQCEQGGGGLLTGEWPVEADGYLISTKIGSGKNPISFYEPFLTFGFQYVEYTKEAVGIYGYKERPVIDGRSVTKPREYVGPYIRATLEDTGHPRCDAFEIKRRSNFPEDKCIAFVEFESEDELWSRYEYRDYVDEVDTGLTPIRWVKHEVFDRQDNTLQANVYQYFMCLSDMLSSSRAGFIGCEGHTPENPQLFACPPLGMSAEAREAGQMRNTVIRAKQ